MPVLKLQRVSAEGAKRPIGFKLRGVSAEGAKRPIGLKIAGVNAGLKIAEGERRRREEAHRIKITSNTSTLTICARCK